ncbi:hypothetical protein E6C27_scaffold34G002980 [Cucumis melo var. makuwa]|uniref:NBS-LRR type resistance protein n=1 Tax=Cucumis melo var. makuwa TaxID=1194695 RepID=A0A5A7SP48_CUCMM|nr:hypothetical protein E6C27_scaffold34G002980 [Cucumis melo var. makuwa]
MAFTHPSCLSSNAHISLVIPKDARISLVTPKDTPISLVIPKDAHISLVIPKDAHIGLVIPKDARISPVIPKDTPIRKVHYPIDEANRYPSVHTTPSTTVTLRQHSYYKFAIDPPKRKHKGLNGDTSKSHPFKSFETTTSAYPSKGSYSQMNLPWDRELERQTPIIFKERKIGPSLTPIFKLETVIATLGKLPKQSLPKTHRDPKWKKEGLGSPLGVLSASGTRDEEGDPSAVVKTKRERDVGRRRLDADSEIPSEMCGYEDGGRRRRVDGGCVRVDRKRKRRSDGVHGREMVGGGGGTRWVKTEEEEDEVDEGGRNACG